LLRINADRNPMELTKKLVREHASRHPRYGVWIGKRLFPPRLLRRVQKQTAAEGIGRLVAGLKKSCKTMKIFCCQMDIAWRTKGTTTPERKK